MYIDIDNVLFLNRSKDMSQSRLIIIATFLIIACIVALGLGLGFVLTKDKESNQEPCGEVGTETGSTTTGTPSPTPTPEGSPSIEGHYRYASIASDTGTCAQIGVYVVIMFYAELTRKDKY
jgi:hypothetical protein